MVGSDERKEIQEILKVYIVALVPREEFGMLSRMKTAIASSQE
jgi:hypothetical protein